jgi:hypothetical protein
MGFAWRKAAMARLFWLPEKAWAVVEQHLRRGKPGRPAPDQRHRAGAGAGDWWNRLQPIGAFVKF